jgi:hypothetical protein
MKLIDNKKAFQLLNSTFHKIDSGFHDPKGNKVYFESENENYVDPKDIEILVQANLISVHDKSDLLTEKKGVAFLNITKEAFKYI